jgi:hypothetical protein
MFGVGVVKVAACVLRTLKPKLDGSLQRFAEGQGPASAMRRADDGMATLVFDAIAAMRSLMANAQA